MSTNIKKTKIAATNRILVGGTTIYCSCDVIREVKPFIMRIEQKYAVLKGCTNDLLKALYEQVRERPDHFPTSSKVIICDKLGVF